MASLGQIKDLLCSCANREAVTIRRSRFVAMLLGMTFQFQPMSKSVNPIQAETVPILNAGCFFGGLANKIKNADVKSAQEKIVNERL